MIQQIKKGNYSDVHRHELIQKLLKFHKSIWTEQGIYRFMKKNKNGEKVPSSAMKIIKEVVLWEQNNTKKT